MASCADSSAVVEGTALSQGFQGPEWSPELTLDFMARNRIEVSILSCAIPLTVFGKPAAQTAALAREINTYMAEFRDKHASRIGFFAILPSLQDSSSCIEEVRYAMETLRADGVALFTSYNDNYLGHPDFEPVWKELNAHSAVVFVHPTMEGIEKSIREPFVIPRALIDWPHETTRTALHLVMTNSLRKHPDCKVILSHGGGTLPYIAGRTAQIPMQAELTGKPPAEFLEDVKRFWFDTALMGDDTAPLHLLLEFAPSERVLYGSDYPFVREPAVLKKAETIDRMVDAHGRELTLVTRGAALKLFPRFTGE